MPATVECGLDAVDVTDRLPYPSASVPPEISPTPGMPFPGPRSTEFWIASILLHLKRGRQPPEASCKSVTASGRKRAFQQMLHASEDETSRIVDCKVDCRKERHDDQISSSRAHRYKRVSDLYA
ncbi:hypothetical protein KP509_29G015900 [Ceratopteris richardii]|nr:hypothetical protein KP509_29G015900 [Ceratopteris richardii]